MYMNAIIEFSKLVENPHRFIDLISSEPITLKKLEEGKESYVAFLEVSVPKSLDVKTSMKISYELLNNSDVKIVSIVPSIPMAE